MKKVQILLSSYNGEKYISRMLDSILSQDYKDLTVLIRDDGSTDSTLDIISNYADSDERIQFISGMNLGVINSFNQLIYQRNKHCDIFMFSDQDDVWLEGKVSRFVDEYERNGSSNMPFLCVADLIVADTNLCTISESFWRLRGFSVKGYTPVNVFFEHHFPGCNMALNASFLNLFDCVPDSYRFFMHDTYYVHISIAKGYLHFIDAPLMYYIQHDNNVVGAKKRLLSKTISTYFCSKYYSDFYHNWNGVCGYLNSAVGKESEISSITNHFSSKLISPLKLRTSSTITSIKLYFVYLISFLFR